MRFAVIDLSPIARHKQIIFAYNARYKHFIPVANKIKLASTQYAPKQLGP